MLNNYHYFLALARADSISAAAEELNVSHQGLSLYLKNLERELGSSLFERTPKLSLTQAGQAVLEAFADVEFSELNLRGRLGDLRDSQIGEFRFGLPEGRFRILMPDLLPLFKRRYPRVRLTTRCAPSRTLRELLLKNELDAALLDQTAADPAAMELEPMLDERLFLAVSDAMLNDLLGEHTAALSSQLHNGAELSLFAGAPFVLNEPGATSRQALDEFCAVTGVALNCVMELPQLDLHLMLASRGYAACFCWSMYLAVAGELNAYAPVSRLRVFPVKGLTARNRLMLAVKKRRALPACGLELVRLLREACARFAAPDLSDF